MSHHRGQPAPNFQDGEYTATAGGETIVPIYGPGGTGTSSRLRRSASVEHNPDNIMASQKPPTGSRSNLPPPSFVRDDSFFNEKITLPRVAANEREHITAEDYDNQDRGSLDNEEQSYDRTVKYSQRSHSVPAHRFEERSSYWSGTAPRGQFFESSTWGRDGGQLMNAPWSSEHQLQQSAGGDQQYAKQTTQQTMERSHNETHDFRRHFYAGGGHHRERHSGGAGQGGYAYEEWHDGDGVVAPYYRPEHTSTLRGASSSKHRQSAAAHQQQQYAAGGGSSYSHHRHHHASSAAAGGGAAQRYGHSQSYYRSGGLNGSGYYKERKYRRIQCCCFPCIWPPWGYEETNPPRPMYYSKPPSPL